MATAPLEYRISEDFTETILTLRARLKAGIELIHNNMDDKLITANNGTAYTVWIPISRDTNNFELYVEDCKEMSSAKALCKLIERETIAVRVQLVDGLQSFDDHDEIVKQIGDNWKVNVYTKIVSIDTVNRIVGVSCYLKFFKKFS